MTNYFKNLVHLKTVYNEFEEMRKREYEKEKKTKQTPSGGRSLLLHLILAKRQGSDGPLRQGFSTSDQSLPLRKAAASARPFPLELCCQGDPRAPRSEAAEAILTQ